MLFPRIALFFKHALSLLVPCFEALRERVSSILFFFDQRLPISNRFLLKKQRSVDALFSRTSLTISKVVSWHPHISFRSSCCPSFSHLRPLWWFPSPLSISSLRSLDQIKTGLFIKSGLLVSCTGFLSSRSHTFYFFPQVLTPSF